MRRSETGRPRHGAEPVASAAPEAAPLDAAPLDAAPLDAAPSDAAPLDAAPYAPPPGSASLVGVPPAAARRERELCGWGGVAPSRALVTEVRRAEDVPEALARAARTGAGAIARGAGRCYGDAAQNAGGEVLDMTRLAGVPAVDRAQGTVRVQAGVTVARLLNELAVQGLTLAVVPGTRYVTVGGAIASDIHGKSHHRDGSFAGQVRSITLCTPALGALQASAQVRSDVFEATLGGMGLTGVVVDATLDVQPLPSRWVAHDTDRTADLEQTLALLAEHDRSRWSVAWLDLLAPAGRLGRGVVSHADPWPRHDTPPAGLLRERPVLQVPAGLPVGALRPSLVRAFNASRWRRSPRSERGRRTPLAGFLFPLDALGGWSRLYGPRGMVQYQLVVPDGREAELIRCVELLRKSAVPVYLAVLKRLGAFSGGPLSFPLAGFTLALDIPAGVSGLRGALDRLDEVVAGAGGRVYLTKDVRMRNDVLPAMYPRLESFLAVRRRVDPDGVLRSDMARRVGLWEPPA